MSVSAELLEILVCPACKGKLELQSGGEALDCGECKLRFPIREDIPVMLVDEAERLNG